MTVIAKKRFFFIVIGILIIILVLCLSFWGYMRMNTFQTYDVSENPIDHYLSSVNSDFVERTQDNLFTGFIPMSVINDELIFQLEKATQNKGIITQGILVDTKHKSVKINYRKQMTIPVFHEMNLYNKKEGLSVEIVPKAFGEKQFKMPNTLNQYIFDYLIEDPIIVQINYEQFIPNKYFKQTSSKLTDEGLFLFFEFYLEDMSIIFQDIRTSANKGLINIYETGTKQQQEALRFLREHQLFPENTMGLIYADYYADAQILKELLVLAEPQLFDNIMEQYPCLNTKIEREDILNKRAELLNQATIKYGRNILNKFQQMWTTGNIVSNYGYFFDLERMEPVTIELIIDLYQMEIPYEDSQQMRLIVDEDQPYVLYDTKEERYFLIGDQSYSLISEEEYQANYAYERPPQGDYTKDAKTYDAISFAIEDALGEEIYIRYMKDDGMDAFVVYSSKLNYQNFNVALLKNKGSGYELIENELRSIKEINESYPNFNLNLITRRIETMKVELLNSSTQQAIKEGLIERGYIDENEIIPYISYDGKKYISIMTGSGDQYIYKIYRNTFLESAYPLHEAIEIFDDINPLLFIQKRP